MFNQFQYAFIKASILYHFDPERHVCIETDTSGFTISGLLNQLLLIIDNMKYKCVHNKPHSNQPSENRNGI